MFKEHLREKEPLFSEFWAQKSTHVGAHARTVKMLFTLQTFLIYHIKITRFLPYDPMSMTLEFISQLLLPI